MNFADICPGCTRFVHVFVNGLCVDCYKAYENEETARRFATQVTEDNLQGQLSNLLAEVFHQEKLWYARGGRR